jgi:endonuclease YncB( thermonuclease family)
MEWATLKSGARVSRKHLDSLCRNKVVEIRKFDVDRHGRTVARVRGDGVK